MTLTEQWEKGELEGEYYIETTKGEIYNVEFQNSISVKKKKLLKVKSFKGYVHKKTVKEVLAPVPSYEEYLSLTYAKEEDEKIIAEYEKENTQLHKFLEEFNALDVAKENKQLNERLLDMIDLLQKCYFYLNAVADGKVKTKHLEQIKTLAVLIDNAIGEKK